MCMMVAIRHLLTFMTLVAISNGTFLRILFNSLSRISQKLEEVNRDIIKESKNINTERTEDVVPRLVKTWGAAVKFPNLLAGADNSNASVNIDRDYSFGLLSREINLGILKLSFKRGYPLKKYTVVTKDGYKLKIHRIERFGPPVFIMHGLLSSSDDFMTAGSKSALAYLLANSGYDVWLGNARGNKHSRRHITLSPSDPKFWDFSWHEIGIYDLPVMIDFVLMKTGRKKLRYIGHSQGTTSFYVMASEKPEYNKKISIMISLAPVAYMSHMTSPLLKLLAGHAEGLYPLLKLVGINEFLPNSAVVQALRTLSCGSVVKANILCSNVLFLIAGFDYAQLNHTNLPVVYGHIPSGAATKQFIHYAQGVIDGDFRLFDYDTAENYQRYGSAQPPKYKLGNITAPVSLIYSDADWLSSATDVQRLRNELGNVVDYHKVQYFPWNHLDYLWAKDFKKILYGHIKKLIRSYD